MVAFITSPIDPLLQGATRARAPSRTCTAVPTLPCKPNSRCDLRETKLAPNTRWGSRSRDPIGYADGLSLYGHYLALDNLDPSGLCAEGCCCIVEQVKISGNEPRKFAYDKKRDLTFFGNDMFVDVKLKYIPDGSGERKPCMLCWGEHTTFVTDPNPYGLIENEWKNCYEVHPQDNFDTGALDEFQKHTEKFMNGDQVCPSKVDLRLHDMPMIASSGSFFGIRVPLTEKRYLSWWIKVDSGKGCGPSKSDTAQQFINIKNGNLQLDSYFVAPADWLGTWPKQKFDCRGVSLPKGATNEYR